MTDRPNVILAASHYRRPDAVTVSVMRALLEAC